MELEQQTREKRIEVSRSMEIRDSKTGSSTTGYTKNLSDNGVRAWLDQTFKAGQILELNMILENDRDPLKTHGEVVWCSPEIYGEGAEVGLKFVEPPNNEEQETPACDNKVPFVSDKFEPGTEVTLLAGDKAMSAVIEEVTERDKTTGEPKHIHIKIRSSDEAEVKQDLDSEAEILASAEDWKADPVRDAKKWFDKYVRPVLRIIKAVIVPTIRIIARGTRKLWKMIPLRPRIRIESFFARFKLGHRASQIKKACITAASFVNRRFQSAKNS